MVGMIAPGKGEEIEERTEKGADQRTQKGRKQTERADLRNRLLYPIPGFSLGNHPDATGRNAEISGGGKKPEVALKRDSNPMPDGPRNMAVNLFLTIPTSMLSPCTPPSNPVYFSI